MHVGDGDPVVPKEMTSRKKAHPMKKCEKCGYMNVDNAKNCFKCNQSFPSITKKRGCSQCNKEYPASIVSCPICGMNVTYYEPYRPSPVKYVKEKRKIWPYVVALLVPVVGLVLGGFFIAKGKGSSVLLTAIFGPIAISISLYVILNVVLCAVS